MSRINDFIRGLKGEHVTDERDERPCGDPEYDGVDALIDGDPIELGKRYREALQHIEELERTLASATDDVQKWVDRAAYYRNIAIRADDDPESFDDAYDRSLARGQVPATELEVELQEALSAAVTAGNIERDRADDLQADLNQAVELGDKATELLVQGGELIVSLVNWVDKEGLVDEALRPEVEKLRVMWSRVPK